MQLDPRQAYPLGHDNKGKLVKVLFARQRRVAELKAEYGDNHPAITELMAVVTSMSSVTVKEAWLPPCLRAKQSCPP